MSHDQKPARVRVIGGGTGPGRRRGDAGALGGRFAAGPTPRAPKAAKAAKAAGGSNRLWIALVVLVGALIGGMVQAYLVLTL